jgi:Meckel syndrome type 1 protein
MPKLYFKVVSVDLSDRHKIEGYGHVQLPRKAGHYQHTLSTWRPSIGFESRLKSFLVGGCPELDDIQYLYQSDVHSLTRQRRL